MKATHIGTCQVCGRSQKLPGNVLSKHGYTKKWGFFNGTCPGAGYVPFEKGYDRIQHSINMVKIEVADFHKQITVLDTEPIGDVAPFRAYRHHGGVYSRPGYYESTVTLSLDANGYVLLTHKLDDTMRKTEHAMTYSLHGTIPEIAVKLRMSKIDRIRGWIDQRNTYIMWQQRRIDTWKPGKLTPVEGTR